MIPQLESRHARRFFILSAHAPDLSQPCALLCPGCGIWG